MIGIPRRVRRVATQVEKTKLEERDPELGRNREAGIVAVAEAAGNREVVVRNQIAGAHLEVEAAADPEASEAGSRKASAEVRRTEPHRLQGNTGERKGTIDADTGKATTGRPTGSLVHSRPGRSKETPLRKVMQPSLHRPTSVCCCRVWPPR